jgi:ribonuclease G
MTLPEWLVERGIGETRAALIDDGAIIEACVELDGTTPAGTVLPARLANIGTNGRNAIAIAEGGAEYLLPRGAAGMTQGQSVTIEVTRTQIPGAESWKRPLARIAGKQSSALPPLETRLGGRLTAFPAPSDALEGWDDLIHEARTGTVTFAGGELRISPTPAMILIDVDGFLPPDELAVLGAGEAAKAVRRLDIGGSIGIDLPTVKGKGARQAAAEALDSILPQPFERTAVNGFGFVQIVRPRIRASLIELAQDRAAFEARALLRRAAFEEPGAKRLVAHPAVIAVLESHGDWLDALSLQAGGAVGLRADIALPISGGYAETA